MLAAEARAVHSMPLIGGCGRFRGVLSTHWRQPQTETGYDVALLDFLARQVAEQMERPQAALGRRWLIRPHALRRLGP